MRRRNLIGAAEMPYRLARLEPGGPAVDTECDSGDYRETLERCLAEFGWEEKRALQGRADRRPLSRRRGRLLYRGRRRRAEGDGAARTRTGRHGVGVCRLDRGRAGPRNGDGADRRRYARPAARAGARVPRLDPLSGTRGTARSRRARRCSAARRCSRAPRPCSKRSGPPPPRGLASLPNEIELVDGRARARRRPLARLRRTGGGRSAGRRHFRQRQQADLHLRVGGGACRGRPGNRAMSSCWTVSSSRMSAASSTR